MPYGNEVYTPSALDNMLIAYMQAEDNFIATKIAPMVLVEKETGKYKVFSKSDMLRDTGRKRAPGTIPAYSKHDISEEDYHCQVYDAGETLADETRANWALAVGADEAMMKIIAQKLMIIRESVFAANFFATGKWGKDVAGVTNGEVLGTTILRWDESGSNPLTDIEYYKAYVQQLTGKEPDTLTVTRDVMSILRNHDEVKDRLSYNALRVPTLDDFAKLFGLRQVLVAKAVVNSAERGATDSISGIMGTKKALLSYSPESPGLMEPAAGKHFVWRAYGDNGMGVRVKKVRNEEASYDAYQGFLAFDAKIVGTDMGVYLYDVIS